MLLLNREIFRWLHDVPVAAQCFAPKQTEEVELLSSCFHPQVRSCIKCDTAEIFNVLQLQTNCVG
jgi:hypothetical protein